MVNHSSILARKIPWTVEPGRLQSMGSQKVGQTERLHFHFHAICKWIHEKNYALKMFCSLVNIALMPISSCDILLQWCMSLGFPRGSVGKESTCNAGAAGLIPGLGRSPEGGHGNPLQYSCLENPHGQRNLVGYRVAKGKTWLSNWAHMHARCSYWGRLVFVLFGFLCSFSPNFLWIKIIIVNDCFTLVIYHNIDYYLVCWL